MKTILLSLMFLFLIGCKAKVVVPAIEKLPLAKIDVAQINKTQELGKRVLNSCNTSRFKPFTTAEATIEVIRNTTPEKISRTCQKFLLKYGAFKEIKLVEIIQNNTERTKIFRYKAHYERKFVTKELRITINQDNKISSIKTTDWTDLFKL